jgi:hypothetical protein
MGQSEKGKVARQKRKVIYTGLDIPVVDPRGDTQAGEPSLIPQIARLKALPFDGIGVHIQDPNPKIQYPQNLVGNNLFSGVRLRYEDYAGAISQLKRLKDTPLTDNFFVIAPCYWYESGKSNKFDWFNEDRVRTTEENLKMFARLARESGVIRGFVLDVEPYRKPTYLGGEEEWAYNLFSLNVNFNLVNNTGGQPDPKGRYERRLRECGKRFYKALDENLKDAPILLYLGYEFAADMRDPNRADLLPQFLDGMLEEIDSRRSKGYLIDGYEEAYRYRRAEEYQVTRQKISGDIKRLSQRQNLYEKHLRVGFAKWLDADEGAGGRWNTTDSNQNFFPPTAWEETLKHALDTTDEYVWVWSAGQARVFNMTYNRTPNVPDAYFDAIRRAKKS